MLVDIALTFFLVMAGLFLGVAGLRIFLNTAVDLARLPDDLFD
jgi:hypothetical protein